MWGETNHEAGGPHLRRSPYPHRCLLRYRDRPCRPGCPFHRTRTDIRNRATEGRLHLVRVGRPGRQHPIGADLSVTRSSSDRLFRGAHGRRVVAALVRWRGVAVGEGRRPRGENLVHHDAQLCLLGARPGRLLRPRSQRRDVSPLVGRRRVRRLVGRPGRDPRLEPRVRVDGVTEDRLLRALPRRHDAPALVQRPHLGTLGESRRSDHRAYQNRRVSHAVVAASIASSPGRTASYGTRHSTAPGAGGPACRAGPSPSIRTRTPVRNASSCRTPRSGALRRRSARTAD